MKMEMCRLCLYGGGEVKILPIFDSVHENLCKKIEECVGLKIDEDDVQTSICMSCINQLNQWESFKDCCHRSNEILNQNDIKVTETKVEIVTDSYQSSTLDTNTDILLENQEDNEEELTTETNELEDLLGDEEELTTVVSKKWTELEELLNDHFDDYSNCISSKYTCEICNQEFDDCLEHLDHQNTHDGEAVFECGKCAKVYSTRKDLVQHDNNHPSPCKQCGKMIGKSSMKLHMIGHTDKYKCVDCSRRFNSRGSLTQHIITVHTDLKEHVCETCGKRFSSQTAVKVHMKSHSDVRKYSCTQCDYAGRTASALYIHKSTHATGLCACKICSKTFKSMRNLNDHTRRFHCKNKKHECSFCSRRFVDGYILRVHMRCHTGVRPYKCPKCDKSFIRSDGLKEHMSTHGQRVFYDCTPCGKKFTSKRGFSRHICSSI